jgi:hypothetical protein
MGLSGAPRTDDMSLDRRFQDYFAALDRAGHGDRCFLCRRTPAEVKLFFGFREDGTPIDAARYGIEDVVLDRLDIMSYFGARPVCAVCQLNLDALLLSGDRATLAAVLREMEEQRDKLWPGDEVPSRREAPPTNEGS